MYAIRSYYELAGKSFEEPVMTRPERRWESQRGRFMIDSVKKDAPSYNFV